MDESTLQGGRFEGSDVIIKKYILPTGLRVPHWMEREGSARVIPAFNHLEDLTEVIHFADD